MSSEFARCHMIIESRFENIELVQGSLAETLDPLGLDAETLYWVDIAVREAVANAIKHGNRLQEEKQVEVDVTVRGDNLSIRVCDQGEGFDPSRVANPLDSKNLLRPSGRGIFYMKSFMDTIEYEFPPQGGTMVVMRKRLGANAGTASEEEKA